MKTHNLINLLDTLHTTRNITDREEAKALRSFKDNNPLYIKLIYSPEVGNNLPYFKAVLTDEGKRYLGYLKAKTTA